MRRAGVALLLLLPLVVSGQTAWTSPDLFKGTQYDQRANATAATKVAFTVQN